MFLVPKDFKFSEMTEEQVEKLYEHIKYLEEYRDYLF